MRAIGIKSFTTGACALGLLGLSALSSAGEPRATDRSATIALASGAIDVHEEPAIPEGLDVAAAGAGAEDVLLVKFPEPVSSEQLGALERRVERIYTYLPHDAFLVKLPAAGRHELLAPAVGASWAGPYHPVYKLSPAVAAVIAGERAAERRSVLLHVFPDAELDDLLSLIESQGSGEIVATSRRDRFSRVRVLMTPAQIVAAREDFARLPQVFFIDLEARRVLRNDTTEWVAQSGTAGGMATPVHDRGILGQGQVVGVLDTGIDPDMCYFADGVLGLPPVNPCDGGTLIDAGQRKVLAVDFLDPGECAGGITTSEWDTHDHGSHVAGTVAGDDFASPGSRDAGDGLAPGAKLVIQDGGYALDPCADLPGLGCPVVDLVPIFQQAYDQGARIHTNSWGDDENGPTPGLYSAGSEDADEFMWNHPDFLLLFAAGNAGPGGTIGSPATAKSVVAVGATLRGSSAETMAGFSSCGQTADGRWKPDVTMPGSGIISADSDNNTGSANCGTRSMSGTSMASPGAAGAAALVRQYFQEGFYPSGTADPGAAFTPSGALQKATLINSGHDMAFASSIPSPCQGWGRVLLDDALHFAGQTRALFAAEDAGFSRGAGTGSVFSFTFEAGEPLEVTLAWTDFPSTPAAGSHLVNDLDLTVAGPGGTYLGNVFSGGQSSVGGFPDRLNTVEQVLLTSPPAGEYTVTVSAFNVPSGPQPFALVVTGDCVRDVCGLCGGDDSSCTLFADGFESGDTESWSQATPP